MISTISIRFCFIQFALLMICLYISGCATYSSECGYPKHIVDFIYEDGLGLSYESAYSEKIGNNIGDRIDRELAVQVIEKSDVNQAYLLLVFMHQHHPGDVAHISKERKSQILVSALRRHASMDDWGRWGSGQKDTHSRKMLLSCGDAAIPFLFHLLNDKEEVAFTHRGGGLRRGCDFAAHIICQLIDYRFSIDDSIKDRDANIQFLKKEIRDNYVIPKSNLFGN